MSQPTKAELRSLLKERRLALPANERRAKSLAVCEKLAAVIDWSGVRAVHYFMPIAKLGEVDIVEFIQELQRATCYTTQKIDGIWKVVDSENAPADSAPQFDVVIVPMLGFDVSLQRVGYGGGYYDRFLAAQPQAQKIGVCFELGRVEHIPAQPHDIPLDLIVTETRIYTL